MIEYVLLAVALTLAIPYAYLLVAIVVVQPRQAATYRTVSGLLATWPFFALLSFLQAIPVLAMSIWWWTCNFSADRATQEPIDFRRPLPRGLIAMGLLTALAALPLFRLCSALG